MKAVLRIRKEPYYRRAAFESGLKRVGFVLDDKLQKPDGPESWLVLWNRQNADEALADAWEAAGGTVIVTENGYLQQIDKTFYAISVHGHNGSGWFPVGDDERFNATGFPVKPWVPDAGHVLVCGQRGIGSRLMRSPVGWGEKVAAKIRGVKDASGRVVESVKLRQHPGNFKPRVPLTDDFRGARACVVWSSAAGVRALVEGVPVFYAAPRWVCSYAAQPFAYFPSVDTRDEKRAEALHMMSHGQWHHEEIATGEPFARIIANRSRASW